MICPALYARPENTAAQSVCLGPACALWLPEIAGSPAAPTGRGNCANNPHAPARKPEE